MHSHTGIKTWALNVGDPKGCQSGGRSALDDPNRQGRVRQRQHAGRAPRGHPEDILGLIREEARTSPPPPCPRSRRWPIRPIFLPTFTPLNNNSRWAGHLNSFLKPCRSTRTAIPTSARAPARRCQAGCFLWDAGTVMASRSPTRHDPSTSRHEPASASRTWPVQSSAASLPRTTRRPIRYRSLASPPSLECADLLDGFGISYTTSSAALDAGRRTRPTPSSLRRSTLKSHVLLNSMAPTAPTTASTSSATSSTPTRW